MSNEILKTRFGVERYLLDFMDQMREDVEEYFWDEFDENALKDGIDEGALQEQFLQAIESYFRFFKR